MGRRTARLTAVFVFTAAIVACGSQPDTTVKTAAPISIPTSSYDATKQNLVDAQIARSLQQLHDAEVAAQAAQQAAQRHAAEVAAARRAAAARQPRQPTVHAASVGAASVSGLGACSGNPKAITGSGTVDATPRLVGKDHEARVGAAPPAERGRSYDPLGQDSTATSTLLTPHPKCRTPKHDCCGLVDAAVRTGQPVRSRTAINESSSREIFALSTAMRSSRAARMITTSGRNSDSHVGHEGSSTFSGLEYDCLHFVQT
jgi:hypothetical protein